MEFIKWYVGSADTPISIHGMFRLDNNIEKDIIEEFKKEELLYECDDIAEESKIEYSRIRFKCSDEISFKEKSLEYFNKYLDITAKVWGIENNE